MPPRKRVGKKRAKTSSKSKDVAKITEDEPVHVRAAKEGQRSHAGDPQPSTSSYPAPTNICTVNSPITVAATHQPSTTFTPPHSHSSTTAGTIQTHTPSASTPVQYYTALTPSHIPSPSFTHVSQLDLTVTYDYGGGFPGAGTVSPRKTIEEISNLFNFKDSNPRVSHHVNLWRDLSPSSSLTPPPPKRHKPHTLTTTHSIKDFQRFTQLASQLGDRLAQHSRDKAQFPGCKTKLALDDDEEDEVECESTSKLEEDAVKESHQKSESSVASFSEEDDGFWATAANRIESPSSQSSMPIAGSTPYHSRKPLTQTELFHASEVTKVGSSSCHQHGLNVASQKHLSESALHCQLPSLSKALDFDQAFENESDDFIDQLLLDGIDSTVKDSNLQRKPIACSKDSQKQQRVTIQHDKRYQSLQRRPITAPRQLYKSGTIHSNQTQQTYNKIDPLNRPKVNQSTLCSQSEIQIKSDPKHRHQNTQKVLPNPMVQQSTQSTQKVQCSQSEIQVKKEHARLKLLARKNHHLSQQ